ncbi:MAG: hypothetical protein IJO52_08140 [Clostridia bacterium]|nr:hypothetical protein [Clostridia bacterium]
MKTANITNGEGFNAHFEKEHSQAGIPFNEAMMDGIATEAVFDDRFIDNRSSVHDVTKQEYLTKMQKFHDFINNQNDYDEVVLWFGDDTFCQLNMLCVLAMLEKSGYIGKISSVLINDTDLSVIKEKSPVIDDRYAELYEEIIVNKRYAECRDPVMRRAVRLYFDYLDENGRLATFIREHEELSEYDLTVGLLTAGEDYGLSDIQAAELIKKYKKI